MNKGAAIIAVLVAFVGGYFLGNFVSTGKKAGTGGSAAVTGLHASASIEDQEKALGPGNPQSERLRALIGPNDPVHGSPDALVTVVEWSDFQCPYCKKGAQTLQEIKKAYSPSQVRVVFKQNPLPFHKDAMPAAEASLAAHEQGKFWEYHDVLFANATKLDRASLEAYAAQVGLDMTKFKAALDTHKFKAQIEADQQLSARLGARGTPTFFVNGKLVRGAQPFEQFKPMIDQEIQFAQNLMTTKKVGASAVYAEIMRDAKPTPAAAPTRPQQPQQAMGSPDPAKTYKVPVGGSPVKGSPDAKLTLIIFSDFQCPHCVKAEGIIKELEAKYGRDLRIVWKNQPLPMHPQAPLAAEAAFAAHEQGKFWEYHDKLFANQKALDQASLERYAEEMKLDMARFRAALASHKFKAAVDEDMKLAAQFAVRGTPAFFVNGRPIKGAQPIENFTALMDQELKEANELLAKGVAKTALYDEIIKSGETKVDAPPPMQRPGQPDPNATYKLEVAKTDAQLGPETAKVTFVLFSDFQCPYCARVAPIVEELAKKYPKDVRIVFKHLPLPMHSNAQIAAEAAVAALQQGKFWPMHDIMFANAKALDRPSLEKYAGEAGLDVGKFKAALDGGKLKEIVQKDMAQAAQFGVRGTPTFFVNGRYFPAGPALEAFEARVKEEIAKADAILAKGVKAKDLYATIIKDGLTAVQAAAPPAADGQVFNIPAGNSPFLGSPSAKVTIIAFSDFQCPYCSRAVPTMHQLAELYPNDVKVVFKQLPLPMHSQAALAAEASLAAHEQGKFWAYHDKLFANQRALDRASLERYAGEVGLDLARFKAALDAGKFKAAVQADMQAAQSAGISGTPTFLVNGRKLAGALPVEQFKTMIDGELAKAKQPAKPGAALLQAGTAPGAQPKAPPKVLPPRPAPAPATP